MTDLALVCAVLVAEMFRLRQSATAKATSIAMCAAPPIAVGIVSAFGSTASILPDILSVVGMSFWLLAGLTGLLLTAGTVGGEFELGTANVIIGRGLPRWLFVVSKGIVLLGVTAGSTLGGWFCGGLAAVVSHFAHAGTSGLGSGVQVLLTSGLVAVGIAVLSAAAYIGLAMAISVLVRSPSFAMFAGLGLYLVDFMLSDFTPFAGLMGKSLGVFSVLGNTNLLMNRLSFAMGADWSGSAGGDIASGTALAVLALYALCGLVAACAILRQQDLRGRS